MISQSEIKYNRLMEKSEKLFSEFGYKAVSMDQIAEVAEISKMTIYKHFSTKEELFLNVVQSIANKSYIYIEEMMKEVEGTIEKIDILLKYNMENSKNYSMAFYRDIMESPDISDKLIKDKKKMIKIIFGNIIRYGVRRGEIREVDEDFIADMLIALIDGLASNFLIRLTTEKDLDDFTEKFYDFLKYGLLGGKGVR